MFYTAIGKDVLADSTLSFAAIGIYRFMSSFPGGVSLKEIIKVSKDPREVRKALDDLQRRGYVAKEGR